MKPLLRKVEFHNTHKIGPILNRQCVFFNDSSQGFAAIHDSDGNWVSLQWMLCMESTTNPEWFLLRIMKFYLLFFLSKVRVQIPYVMNMWFVNQWDLCPSKIMVTLLENALSWQMNPTPGIVHTSICICAQIWSAPEMNTFYEIPPRPKC